MECNDDGDNRHSWRNMTTTALLSLVPLILLTSCITGLATAPPDTHDTIKIGAVLPLNGYGAETGQSSLRGYQLAIDEINRERGVDSKLLELVVADHIGDDTKGAISAYQSLYEKDIKIILGPNFSPLGQAIAPIACHDGAILISPAIGIKEFTTACPLIFTLWPVDEQNSRELGARVVMRGYRRIAIVGSVQSWELEQAEAVKAGVESMNGTIVSYTITDNNPGDYLTEATKVQGENPDAIIMTDYGYMSILAQRLRTLGSDAAFFAIVLDESRKKSSQGAFEGTIGISSFTPIQEFKAKYLQRYGAPPDFNSDTSYDAVKILAKAIQETKSMYPVVLSRYISSLTQYDGASGNLTFTPERTVKKTPVFQIVVNDTIRAYDWDSGYVLH